MPIRPPRPLKSIDDIDKKLSPHSAGMKLPMVDPTIKPNQIKDLVFTLIV
jgi:hypothetical protein